MRFADRIAVMHQALDAAGVAHAFGGAVALAYHVREPRATRDLDLNISVPTAAAHQVLHALPDDIEVGDNAAATIVADGQIRLWWDGRDGVPVDLFFPQHPFHDEVERATTLVPFENGTIPIISATHLTVFKCLYDRARDWPDVAAMLEAGTVDTAVALDWVGTLLGEDSAPYLKLAELVVTARAGGLDAPGSEMERPRVDWKALPGS
jgi:hypothetical protein